MVRVTLSTLIASAFLSMPALAQNYGYQSQGVPQQTQQLLQHMAQDNQGEIQAAILAEKQAASPAVKAFARLMVEDHMALESQLAAVLGELRVPAPPGGTQQDQAMLQRLGQLDGHSFDVTFMRAQIQNHQQDIQQLQQGFQTAQNFQLRALIAGALPILQQHLALAEAVDQMVNSGQQNVAGTYR